MPRFETRIITDPREFVSASDGASACRDPSCRFDICQDGRWLVEVESRCAPDARPIGVALERAGELAGFAPLVASRWQLECTVGCHTLARFPMRAARFQGDHLLARPGAEETLLREVVRACARYPILVFENVPLRSRLRELLQDRSGFGRVLYEPKPPQEHYLIRLPATLDDYYAGFKRKTRETLRRKRRRLQDACGELTLERATDRPALAAFLEEVRDVACRSWQSHALGEQITDTVATRLERAADRGWLRSYLLRGGGRPLAYAVGRQAGGVYTYDIVGFDPDERWRKHSPGQVLLCLMLEDLYADRTPTWFDFRHGAADYKRSFANTSYQETDIYLVRPGLYTGLGLGTHWAVTRGAKTVKLALDHLDLLDRVQTLRRRSRLRAAG